MESGIIFFDGVCGLCNRTVDFLVRRDRRGVLKFAPLQGSTAGRRLGSSAVNEPDTIVYLRQGRRLNRSTAVLRALADLGGGWRAVLIFLVLPRFLRDAVYNFVARNRYRWFGKHDTCRIPSPEERSRFLD